jgi:hypothetical protein
VPFAMWMRGPWADSARDVLLDRRTRERGIIDATAVRRLIDAHETGTTQGGDAIWSLLNLELWYRTFIDGGGIQTLPVPASLMRPRAAFRADGADAGPHAGDQTWRGAGDPGTREKQTA